MQAKTSKRISPWESLEKVSVPSPDGKHTAIFEYGGAAHLYGPSYGKLIIPGVLTIEDCNPSLVWSDDSRFLATIQWLGQWQRLMIIDVEKRLTAYAPNVYGLLELHAFVRGMVCGIDSPAFQPQAILINAPALFQTTGAPDSGSRVLTTRTIESLPTEFQSLLDRQRRIPPRVEFFEHPHAAGEADNAIGSGVILTMLGSLIVGMRLTAEPAATPLISYFNFLLPIFGLVGITGGLWTIASLLTSARINNQRKTGKQTRYGIFLLPDVLMVHTGADFTIIPRDCIAAFEGRKISYWLDNTKKTLKLPGNLISPAGILFVTSILRWAANGK